MKKYLSIISIVCIIVFSLGCAWEKLSGKYYEDKEEINIFKNQETELSKESQILNENEEENGEDEQPAENENIDEEYQSGNNEELNKELETLFITAEQFYSRGLEYANDGKWELAEEEFENALELLHNSSIGKQYPDEINNFYNELSLEIIEKLENNEDLDVKTREEILLAQIRAKPGEERTIKEKVTLDLREIGYDIPIDVNDKVIRYIEYFTVENKEKFETWLQRSGAYMPILRAIFKEEGLPLDLTYLPIIESAFKTGAYSRARAAGLWQFIPGTATKYGLNITWWVDERRDFEKSTRSAAKYLKFLNEKFDSWNLSLAGYNAGEGRVERTMNSQNTKDFWSLRLPRETMNYIPAFLASVIVAKNPAHYGLNVEYEDPISYEKLTIDRSVDLETIAKCAKTTKEEITRLNPEIRYWATPPIKNYTIRIPEGMAEEFKENFAKVKETYSLAWNKYTVKRDDSLSLISRNFGVPTAVIAEANKIHNPRLIREGQTLLVPNKWSKEFNNASSYRAGELIIHIVRRGETLSHIAGRYSTSVSSIMRWNNLTSNRKIYSNQKLKVYAGLTSTDTVQKIKTADISNSELDKSGRYTFHKVKSGENLWLISRKYGVSISELMKWNGIRYASRIQPGQSLKVYIDTKTAIALKDNSLSEQKNSVDKTTSQIIHEVKRGDSLWSISKQYGVSISNLKEWNGLKSSGTINPGDKIKIIPLTVKETSQPVPSSRKNINFRENNKVSKYIIHNVRKGETLWVIAKRYGVSIANIMEWNNINSAKKIRPSQKLKIYKKELLNS